MQRNSTAYIEVLRDVPGQERLHLENLPFSKNFQHISRRKKNFQAFQILRAFSVVPLIFFCTGNFQSCCITGIKMDRRNFVTLEHIGE